MLFRWTSLSLESSPGSSGTLPSDIAELLGLSSTLSLGIARLREQSLPPGSLPSDIAKLGEEPLQSRLAALFHRTSLSLERRLSSSAGALRRTSLSLGAFLSRLSGALSSDVAELRTAPLSGRLALFYRTSLSLEQAAFFSRFVWPFGTLSSASLSLESSPGALPADIAELRE